MASVRDLKKDINYVLGDIIEAVYIIEDSNQTEGSKEGSAIIDKAIETFDTLIAEVNQKDVADRKKHLNRCGFPWRKKQPIWLHVSIKWDKLLLLSLQHFF